MELKQWELSFGLFTGLLFGYRSYPDVVDNKVDHVLYVFIFDICLTLKYLDTKYLNIQLFQS